MKKKYLITSIVFLCYSFMFSLSESKESDYFVPPIEIDLVEVEAICNGVNNYTYKFTIDLCQINKPNGVPANFHSYIRFQTNNIWEYIGVPTLIDSSNLIYEIIVNTTIEYNIGTWVMQGAYNYLDPSVFYPGMGHDSCHSYRLFEIPEPQGDCSNCDDEPYIQPYWSHPNCPQVVCSADKWPIQILSSDGVTPITTTGGVIIEWDNLNTPTNEAILADWIWTEPNETWQATIIYPNGCIYVITYIEDCCDDDVYIEPILCPTQEQIKSFIKQAENTRSQISEAQNNAIEQMLETFGSTTETRDCDPCDIGFVLIHLVDENGNDINPLDYDSIIWSDGGLGTMRLIPVDLLISVTAINDDGNYVCIYQDDFIHNCKESCELSAPTNLQNQGNILTWDPVPGAIGYIVTSPSIIDIQCCVSPSYLATTQLELNNYPLSSGLQGSCFVWQVAAICSDETLSPVSEQLCHIATGVPQDDGPLGEKVFISPNPNKGIMDIKVETGYDTNISLDIYTFDGILVKTIANNVVKDAIFTMNLDERGLLQKGMYFFIFKTNKEIITKKVIIE